jgi:SAM-dependent methyltransferase
MGAPATKLDSKWVWERTLRPLIGFEARQKLKLLLGEGKPHWFRIIMNAATAKLLRALPFSDFDVLEVSGKQWKDFGFKTYRSVHYPPFDICESALPEQFDLIIAEQVFEHLLWPRRAATNVFQMLRPGGYFLITTPFLLRLHDGPFDCSRWSETGLKYFLADCGFPLDKIHTDSWGNRPCARRNLITRRFLPYRRWLHPLHNEPRFPVVVWALAQK